MKKTPMTAAQVSAVTKKSVGPIILFSAMGTGDSAKKDGEGEEGEDDELKAIKAVGAQIKTIQEKLGETVSKEDITKIESALKALEDGLATLTSAEVVKQMNTVNDILGKFQAMLVAKAEEEAEAEEQLGGTGMNRRKSTFAKEADVKAFVETLFPEGKDGIKKHSHVSIEMKAAEQFGFNSIAAGADVNAITGAFVDPTLYAKRRKTNIILDYFDIRVINVPTLIYLRKLEEGAEPDTEDSGGAVWIACGQAKPMRSFRITTGEANAKKVAIFNTIDDCLLQDVPSFDRWIREDFVDEMREEINNGLLNGDPDVNNLEPTGLKKNAVLFSASPAFTAYTTSPNYIDAVFAIAATFAVNRERARVIFVSADVFYSIHALKTTDGAYMNNNLIYIDNLGRLYIGGVEIVYVDSEDVPSTHFLAIGIDLGFKIYAYGNMVIETGLNGEDFREDKTSIRGWQRFLSFIPEERENSVMYDTWANVFAAILEPAEPLG